MGERERTWTLFAWAFSAIVFMYWEMTRRQSLSERREESRRNYVDKKLGDLDGRVGRAEAKAEGAREASESRWKPWEHRALVLSAIAGVAGVVVYLIVYHVF